MAADVCGLPAPGLPARGGRGDVGGTTSFEPHASYLNVLPSRQNVFWSNRASTPSLCSSAGLLLPKGLYAMEGVVAAERKFSQGQPSTPKSRGASIDNHCTATVDLSDAVADKLRPLLSQQHRLLGDHPPAEDAGGTGQVASHEGLDVRDAISMSEAVFNLSNTVLGIGVLSVPYAFRLSGYFSLVLVWLIILVTSQTGEFIGAALVLAARSPAAVGVPRRGRDFAFLAHVAFGPRGRTFIGAVTSLEIWLALVTFMVMNGINAAMVMPGLRREPAVLSSCILAALTCFVPMRVFSYLSLVASAALFTAAFAMVGAALTMPSWANPYEHMGEPALLDLRNMPRSVGIIVFCFAGHPCFPIVHECMKDRTQWRLSVRVTFLLAFIYYGGLGVFGYLVFGQYLEAPFTQNLAKLSGAVLWRSLSALAFLVKIQLTAPLLFNAIVVSVWAPKVGDPEWPLRRVVVLCSLTIVTAITAVTFANDVAAVASLTGSLFTMTTSVIFPALVHLRLGELYGEKDNRLSARSWHYFTLLFGAIMAASGTALSASDMLS